MSTASNDAQRAPTALLQAVAATIGQPLWSDDEFAAAAANLETILRLTRAEMTQDAPFDLLRLPLPAPGYAILYGQDATPGSFFLLLELPDGERRPLPW